MPKVAVSLAASAGLGYAGFGVDRSHSGIFCSGYVMFSAFFAQNNGT